MKTFIMGGTSSIGRVLIKTLAKDSQQLRVLVRQNSNRTGLELPGVEFVIGDVTDPESVPQSLDQCWVVRSRPDFIPKTSRSSSLRRISSS